MEKTVVPIRKKDRHASRQSEPEKKIKTPDKDRKGES